MKRKKIKFFLSLFLALVLARFLVVPNMGSWLVKDDALLELGVEHEHLVI